MTAPTEAQAPAEAQAATPPLTADLPRPRAAARGRRRHRVVIPLALALALILGTVLTHWLNEPDHSDQGFLSPADAAAGGGPDATGLRQRLRDRDIPVQTFTRTPEALTAAWGYRGDATLVIPAPEFVHREYLPILLNSPAGTRIVLVEPGPAQLDLLLPALRLTGTRWATAVTAPGPSCALTKAGPAAVTRSRYAVQESYLPEPVSCYDGGLLRLDHEDVELVLVGSADPFRTDRISEHDNATLALDLLGTRSHVIWLDLHKTEPGPDKPRSTGRPRSPSEAEPPPTGPQDSPFPDWLKWTALMLLLAAATLAVARGRRLGPPVPEPLPIEVVGAETAIGRGRLYQRAKARGPALETLRISARRRLAGSLGLPLGGRRDHLLDALSARIGEDPTRLADILYGPAPSTDQELHLRATELRLLLAYVTATQVRQPPPGNEGEPGD